MSVADKYQILSEVEHILVKPGMYIGSPQLINEPMHIVEGDFIVKKTIDHIPGLQRLYEEIILNAFDQTARSGTGCNEIRVNVSADENVISVWNNGQGLPVVFKDETNCYIPEMVFGMLRSGSNYDETEERVVSGLNGLGAKLVNIFSLSFNLETADSDTKKIYQQSWRDHMSEKDKPTIKSLGRKKPYTIITYSPDLAYFKIPRLSDDMVALMKKRLIDIGFASNSKVKTFFNDEELTIKRTEDYMKLYASITDHSDSFIVDASCERWTVGLSISTNGFMHASFVNGIHTSLGGSHVDHVFNVISKEVIEKLKSKKIEVKPSQIKDKLCLFIKCAIVNPIFDSQTKECLKMAKSKFGSEYVIADAFKKKLLSSNLIKILSNVADNNIMKDLSKTNGVKTARLIGIKGLEDANWAGTAKSQQTKLILTEGLSAKTFAMSAITVIGRDRFGIFPLKGKPLNVRDITLKKVMDNVEICSIVKILGLKYGTKYTDTMQLRYGGVISLSDADADGSHICGLIMNVFHVFWPELLAMNYLGFCSTPIVKVSKNNKVLESFYTLNDYEAWIEANSHKHFTTKYFKGLGTSTAAEAREALSDIDNKIISFDADQLTNETMNLAFNKKQAEDRKLWLMERYSPKDNIDRKNRLCPVSDYINKELIHFSYYDNQRSIPNIMDGLKPSQRKILHTAIKYLSNGEMKVAQFGAKVAEKTDYHHGEASLMGAIIGMAQNYMGSNNINLLEPIGAFGSRLSNGKDAASPRYIFTALSKIAKCIFDSKDAPLLNYLNNDGILIEPEWFAPVIPMVLVNGALGIGSGFSTTVLKYNPEQICMYLLQKMRGEKPVKNLTPWYRGFNGSIEKLQPGKYVSHGVFEFNDVKRAVVIKELPIGVSTDDYKDTIEEMLADKGNEYVSDIHYGNSDTIVHMDIIINNKKYAEVRDMDSDAIRNMFKLSSKLSSTNMFLFNHKGIMTKYNNIYEIINEFFKIRMEMYDNRRNAIIDQLKYELMILANKVRFIKDVKSNKVKLATISDTSLLAFLVDNDYDQDRGINGSPLEEPTLKEFAYMIDMPIRTITLENAKKLQAKHDEKQAELDLMLDTTAVDMWEQDINDVIRANKEQNDSLIIANSMDKPKVVSKKKATKPRATKK